MSAMKDLYIEICNLGIDPHTIDLKDVEGFIEAYRDKTGHTMTILNAIELMCGG